MEPSPTGTPVLSPKFVPYALLAGAVLTALAAQLADATPWTMAKVGKLLASIVPAVLGILSPGLRKGDASGVTSATKALLVVTALGFGVSTARAAAPDVSSGPTIPLLEVRLGDSATKSKGPAVLSAGAGYMVSAGFLPTLAMGKKFNLVQLSLAAFASGSATGGQASIAAFTCTLNQLVCVGFGTDLLSFATPKTSGLLVGNVTGANLFALLSVGFEIGFGPKVPASGMRFDDALWGLERGNTVTF